MSVSSETHFHVIVCNLLCSQIFLLQKCDHSDLLKPFASATSGGLLGPHPPKLPIQSENQDVSRSQNSKLCMLHEAADLTVTSKGLYPNDPIESRLLIAWFRFCRWPARMRAKMIVKIVAPMRIMSNGPTTAMAILTPVDRAAWLGKAGGAGGDIPDETAHSHSPVSQFDGCNALGSQLKPLRRSQKAVLEAENLVATAGFADFTARKM